MIPTAFEYPEWIDNNLEELALKKDAPEDVKKHLMNGLMDLEAHLLIRIRKTNLAWISVIYFKHS